MDGGVHNLGLICLPLQLFDPIFHAPLRSRFSDEVNPRFSVRSWCAGGADFAEGFPARRTKSGQKNGVAEVAVESEELDVLRKGLQNLYASVRFRPAPPTLFAVACLPVGSPCFFTEGSSLAERLKCVCRSEQKIDGAR